MGSSRHLPTFEDPDSDPLIFLEDSKDPRTIRFVNEQNAQTIRKLGSHVSADVLRVAQSNQMCMPLDSCHGDYVYNFSTDIDHPRGLWQRCHKESYCNGSPDWDVLLDINATLKNQSEGGEKDLPSHTHYSTYETVDTEKLVWQGYKLSPDQNHAMLNFSLEGSNDFVQMEFDLVSHNFVTDGFNIPPNEALRTRWIDNDTLLVTSYASRKESTARIWNNNAVRKWHRGEPQEMATIVFSVAGDHRAARVSAIANTNPDEDDTKDNLLFTDQITPNTYIHYLGNTDGPSSKPLDLPEDVDPDIEDDMLLVKVKRPWAIGPTTYRACTVLAFSLSQFMSGVHEPTVLYEPSPRTAISSADLIAGRAVLFTVEKMKPKIMVFEPPLSSDQKAVKSPWTAKILPIEQNYTHMTYTTFDVRKGNLLLELSSRIHPPTVYLASIDCSMPRLLSTTPPDFDAVGLSSRYEELQASDGFPLSFMITGPSVSAGPAHVLMNGRVHWGHIQETYYDGYLGAEWLAKGGSIVDCNIRGGGGRGSDQHVQGQGILKYDAQEDFATICSFLVKHGISKPSTMGCCGRGWEATTIANMVTRHHDKFAAFLCEHPMIDLRRDHIMRGADPKFYAPEYVANFEDPETWKKIRGSCPYHQGTPFVCEPSGKEHFKDDPETAVTPKASALRLLVTTSSNDNYNFPGHGRKFACKQQGGIDAPISDAVSFYETRSGGQLHGVTAEQRALAKSLEYRFLRLATELEQASIQSS